jgi:HlyD family secretion protein
MKGIDAQIDQIQDQINKSAVINPVKGTVLMKLAEQSEIVNYGKPLYKIADISVMELRVYVSGEQLPGIKLGQIVRVLIDSGNGGFRELEGTISWISSKSEFTPKIIQTKEERVNLVYAVKVRVANDGSLKIGMPGEIVFK